MGGFRKEAPHASLRTAEPPVGTSATLVPRPPPPWRAGTSVEAASPDAQRHPLASSLRCPLARHPATLRTLADGLRPLPALADRRFLDADPHLLARSYQQARPSRS